MNPSLNFEIYLDLKVQYLDIIYQQYLCCIFYVRAFENIFPLH